MHPDVIKVFIGYDHVESVAWHTMAASIYRQSSRPVAIVPINLANLKGIFNRPRDPKQSNEFSFSRFLVPYLCNYEGKGIFFDCDQMLRTDIAKIFSVMDEQPDKAVYVVKHTYEPRNDLKYLNTVQYKYPRKNWSSVVLWNCEHTKNKIVTRKNTKIRSGSGYQYGFFLCCAAAKSIFRGSVAFCHITLRYGLYYSTI
jgi:lipopolysaccharide biosynthesis glycosyltransferase